MCSWKPVKCEVTVLQLNKSSRLCTYSLQLRSNKPMFNIHFLRCFYLLVSKWLLRMECGDFLAKLAANFRPRAAQSDVYCCRLILNQIFVLLFILDQ